MNREWIIIFTILIAILLAISQSNNIHLFGQKVISGGNEIKCKTYDDCFSYLKEHYTEEEIENIRIGCNREECVVILP